MNVGDRVMCGAIEAVVKCAEEDGDGNVVVALERRGGFFYSVVKPESLSTTTEVVIDGVTYVVDLTSGTIRPKEASR
jgi:hypothetical protein